MADSATPSPSFPRQRDGDGLLQYYIAVDRLQYKMGTLVDLLEVLERKGGLPLSICCGSRDTLDAVCAALTASQQFTISFLHSDLAESERASTLDSYRNSILEWNESMEDVRLGVQGTESKSLPSHLLVMTDVCLPSNSLGEAPLAGRVMINYDLPSKKEAYMRRVGACLSHSAAVGSNNGVGSLVAGGVVINVVVGGEVNTLRGIEESCGVVIEEMPIHISELLW